MEDGPADAAAGAAMEINDSFVKSAVDSVDLEAVDGDASSGNGFLQGVIGKIKERINSGVEGEVMKNLKNRVGVDAEQLILQERNSGWSVGLIFISFAFIAGGLMESYIVTSAEESLATAAYGADNATSSSNLLNLRRPLTLLLGGELVVLLLTLPYTPLTLSLPAIGLHQVVRVIGTAVRGKPIGGGGMRLGMAGIILGFAMTSLFGFHQSPLSHDWETIVNALYSLSFQIWAAICALVAIISLSIAYLLPARPAINDAVAQIEREDHGGNGLILSICKALRLNCLVYLLSKPVSWSTKQHSFALVTGILTSYLVLIAQQITLTLSDSGAAFSLVGLQTILLAFGCGIYAMICLIVMRHALATFESSKFLPPAMCWIIWIGTLNEVVLNALCFGDSEITVIRSIFYFAGVSLICVGLVFMGQADVRQQLEDLQFLANEVSRLGVMIEGTFNEANNEGTEFGDIEAARYPPVGFSMTQIPGVPPPYTSENDWLEIGNVDFTLPPLTKDDEVTHAIDGPNSLSDAIHKDDASSYVKGVLSDIRMG